METKTLPKFSTKFGNLAFVLVTMLREPRAFSRKEIQDRVKAWRAPEVDDELAKELARVDQESLRLHSQFWNFHGMTEVC